jgi:hypothetical protein
MQAALLLRLFTLLSVIHGGSAATRAAQLAFVEEQAAAPSRKRRRGGWTRVGKYSDEPGDAGKLAQHRHRWSKRGAWELLEDKRTYDPTSREGKEFRLVSRLTRERFDYLVERLQADPFLGDAPADGKGRPPKTPLKLKVICVLAVLGGGLSFVWIARWAGISKGEVRTVFHKVLEWLVVHEYDRWVTPPTEEADIRRTEARFARMGFPGCITCFDGVHWRWDNVPAGRHYMYNGKESYPSVAFNVACDSTTRVHHVYGSSPGAVNDKTMARLDPFMVDMHLNGKYADHTFQLYNPNTMEYETHKGLYSICDGGYHLWRVTQAPVKHASREWDRKYSKRMESVRKCVECLFGRLKKRFLILNKGTVLKNEAQLSRVFKVCCMLHNILLVDDGYHTIGDLPGDWGNANTDLDEARIRNSLTEQGACFEGRTGRWVDDVRVGNETVAEVAAGYAGLQMSLVAHYRVAIQKKDVMWPKTVVGSGRKAKDTRPLLPGGEASREYAELCARGEEDEWWFDGENWQPCDPEAEDE